MLAEKRRREGIESDPIPDIDETARIVGLPTREPAPSRFRPEEMTARLRRPDGEMVLRDIQADALAQVETAGGLVGTIGVGWGKSLIAILIPSVLDVEAGVIVAPARTLAQLRRFYGEARKHFFVKPINILSYTDISRPNGETRLRKLCDDRRVVLVFDEAHKLKNDTAARTKRVKRLLHEREEIPVAVLSGTMTGRSITDYAHLAEWALRDQTPIPRGGKALLNWADCVDVGRKHDQLAWHKFSPLWEWYKDHLDPGEEPVDIKSLPFFHKFSERRDIGRRAVRHRSVSSPGWTATTASALGCTLLLVGRVTKVPEHVGELIERLGAKDEFGDYAGCTPDGEPVEDPLTAARMARYLSQGFWYRWDWTFGGAAPEGKPDEDWLKARSDWARRVRGELNYKAARGYDSPLLVWNVVHRETYLRAGWCACTFQGAQTAKTEDCGRCTGTGSVSVQTPVMTYGAIRESLLEWEREKRKEAPPTLPVWESSFLIDDAIQWASEQKEPVILWYGERAVADKLRSAGLPVYGGGTEPPIEGGEYVPHTCAMSIHAHGTGKNFQGWRNQICLSPPSNGKAWEQLLGRTHRPGQEADDVEFHVYLHTGVFLQALGKAREDADYIKNSTGNEQKLLIANRS